MRNTLKGVSGRMVMKTVGARLTREGGLSADLRLVDCGQTSNPVGCQGVHIHCCDNGLLWFRFYSDSLFQTPKRKQKALP
ncbi:hypothetical protein, partial [Pseudomonas umsongensis]|uniref:hypothetical protein n=1 Tax=Pseudomonas umsongensis TaxID=198618 RepID=UPI00200A4F25